MKNILVTGSAGFIGGHLVKRLRSQGHYVIGADIEDEKYFHSNYFHKADLTDWLKCHKIFSRHKIDEVYNLACLMGGMGFIGDEKHAYDIMVGSSQIISNILHLSIYKGVTKHFYSSSACVYNMQKQDKPDVVALKESDAYPSMPDLTYGWQKLFSERMYEAAKSKGLDIRIARFHNIFGEYGTFDGGKEKAPAALCRKVAKAKDGDEIEVWGTGTQTRSFLYIEECLDGVERLMNGYYDKPINIGSDELISINDLAKMIINISGKKLTIKNIDGNVGVNGRNSDNSNIQKELGWKPSQPLQVGIEKLYKWINFQVNHRVEWETEKGLEVLNGRD